jgi:hypothetical protein
MREPSQRPEPKSACRPSPVPIEAMIAAEFFATGRRSTRLFHGLLFGKTVREQSDDHGGNASSHAVFIGSDLSVQDPPRQVPEDLLPAASLSAKFARVCDGSVPSV